LVGALISVTNSDPIIATTSDENGAFTIKDVPIGRQSLTCQYIGYEQFRSEDFILGSARAKHLDIELLESAVEMDEIVVKGNRFASQAVNELAVVSARSFSAEETERIPTGVNDPGRMALSFPGVQQGGNDSENDIIIRGNSSFGMLWRLEGIDIPNPNHFARPGTSGGGITIFSAQLLDRSDFYSGAMAAEYGNALSGAMDVRFRKGNRQARTHRAKIGLIGLDFATEGPIKQGQSSYLVNYRYSTLGLLNNMGFYLVGERVDNIFQDLSFNLTFDGKDKRSFFTVFGLGGLSKEVYNPVADPTERELGISNHWEDRLQQANTGIAGVTYTRLLDDKSYLKAVVAGVASYIDRIHDTLSITDERYRYNTEYYNDKRISTTLQYNRKINSQTLFKAGIFGHLIKFDFFKESSPRSSVDNINMDLNEVSINGGGNTSSLQYFALVSRKLGDKLTMNAGLHGMNLFLNNTSALDPRLSFKYELASNQTLSLALGKHSQWLPLSMYFYNESIEQGNETIQTTPNFDLPPIVANHAVLSYNFFTKSNIKFGVEAYYQTLANVPVEADGNSIWWMLNNQSDIPRMALVSEGKGQNYGVDVAVEKFFSNKIYFILTGSRFESKYELADGRVFDSKFGTEYASTLTLGKEFTFKKGQVLQIGARTMYNGGFRYTPHDVAASLAANAYVPDFTNAFGEQVGNYFRLDTRIAWRTNKANRASNLSLDIQNVTDTRNPSNVGYNAVNNELFFRNHPGSFLPVISWEVIF